MTESLKSRVTRHIKMFRAPPGERNPLVARQSLAQLATLLTDDDSWLFTAWDQVSTNILMFGSANREQAIGALTTALIQALDGAPSAAQDACLQALAEGLGVAMEFDDVN